MVPLRTMGVAAKPGLAIGMEEEDGEEAVRRAWLRWLGVGTGSLALVLIGLWTQRAPIAENFISRELNRRGVQANYDLVDVGLRTQRIENIVLGDPAHPDLTAQWVEVDIAFAGLTPQVAAVRAGGVRMRASMREGVLRLGEIETRARGARALLDRTGSDECYNARIGTHAHGPHKHARARARART